MLGRTPRDTNSARQEDLGPCHGHPGHEDLVFGASCASASSTRWRWTRSKDGGTRLTVLWLWSPFEALRRRGLRHRLAQASRHGFRLAYREPNGKRAGGPRWPRWPRLPRLRIELIGFLCVLQSKLPGNSRGAIGDFHLPSVAVTARSWSGNCCSVGEGACSRCGNQGQDRVDVRMAWPHGTAQLQTANLLCLEQLPGRRVAGC